MSDDFDEEWEQSSAGDVYKNPEFDGEPGEDPFRHIAFSSEEDAQYFAQSVASGHAIEDGEFWDNVVERAEVTHVVPGDEYTYWDKDNMEWVTEIATEDRWIVDLYGNEGVYTA